MRDNDEFFIFSRSSAFKNECSKLSTSVLVSDQTTFSSSVTACTVTEQSCVNYTVLCYLKSIRNIANHDLEQMDSREGLFRPHFCTIYDSKVKQG